VQGAADFHHLISDALLPQAQPVFHDATALHTAVDMFNPQPALMQRFVRQVLVHRQRLARRLPRWHEDFDLRQREAEKPQILQQLAPCRQRIRRGVRNALVMRLTAVRVTQKQDGERRIH